MKRRTPLAPNALRFCRRCALLAVWLLAVLVATPWAAADTWDNSSGNAQWSTAANWADNSEPASTAEPVTFPNAGGFYNANISLSAGEVCGSLTFDAIYNFSSGTLNVGAAGGPISVNPSVTATINSVLNGTQGLTKSGAGTLTLGGANTFTGGGVTVNAGTLSINDDSRLGNSGNDVVIDGGTLQSTASLLSSRSFTLSSSGAAMTVAGTLTLFEDGALAIAAGASVSSAATSVAANAGSNAVVSVSGDWIMTSNLLLGTAGTGTMNITGGGQVQSGQGQLGINAGSTGIVTVDGDGSAWNCGDLTIGDNGKGTLLIEAGGSVSSAQSLLGGSNGSGVTVTGVGSTWAYSSLLVNNDLRIEAGGSVSGVGSIIVGLGTTATVTGPGSTWTNVGPVFVDSPLTIEDGGSASSATAVIRDVGTVTVTGAGSSWTISGAVQMEPELSPVKLAILDGGAVTIGGNITDSGAGSGFETSQILLERSTLDMTNHSIGGAGDAAIDFLTLRSGTLKNVAQINNGAVPLIKTTAGTLILDTANGYTGGTAVNEGVLHVSNTAGSATGTGTVTIASGAALQGTGFVGGPVQNNGSVAPGASAGILTIENSYTQTAGGTLEIEIGGMMVGSQHDRLTIVGNAALDGILDVALINGFSPVAGQQFTVLTAGSIVDNGLALGGSAASSFSLLVNSSSVILQAIEAGLPGDYNNDGTVDAADYVVWRKTDGSQNGYNTWRMHFGESIGSGSGATADVSSNAPPVPEPASLLLVGLSVAMARCRSRCARASIARCL